MKMEKIPSIGKAANLAGVGVFLTAIVLAWGMVSPAQAIPSFSRQTGMSCAACHTVFPELTSYGRWFKLNGYVSGEADQISDKDEKTGDVALEIQKAPPLSAMIQVSDEFVNNQIDPKPSAGDDNRGFLAFPAQFSLFYSGEITPNIGSFVQVTYDANSGTVHWDNTDIRYATHFNLGGVDTIFGLTLNNNPTVQDVFNTVPAWGFPYAVPSSNLPSPASPQITGLGGNVGGLGVYLYLDKLVYLEGSLYRTAPQGFGAPVTYQTLEGYAPYGRLALMQEFGDHSVEIGATGMVLDESTPDGNPILPGISPDRYVDYSVDAQYQYVTKDLEASIQASWINEDQTLNASQAATLSANLSNNLQLFRIAGTLYSKRQLGLTLAYFEVDGTTDTSFYAPSTSSNPYTGSANGSPDSNGLVYEINYVPWLNTKLSLQYTEYFIFNGGSNIVTNGVGYDGLTPRKASDNNTLMAMAWFAY